MGRPPYPLTPELAETICARLASGESLRRICSDEDMPSRETVMRWVIEDRDGFAGQYTRAREMQAESMNDELMEIADVGTGDVQRDKLRVDTRKWYLSKVLPKFADKQTHEHTGGVTIHVAGPKKPE